MEILFHTVLFMQIQAHHWNAIENPALVIELLSGMIVFDLHMMGIDGTDMARWHSTFPHSTCSARWSALLKWHQNLVLAIRLSCHIILYIHSESRFDVISRIFPAAQCLGRKDVVLLGKFRWSHQICPHCVCAVWFGMRAILLGPDILCHSNSTLHFVLQVLHGNILCHLANSVPSTPIICRSHMIIPLMS